MNVMTLKDFLAGMKSKSMTTVPPSIVYGHAPGAMENGTRIQKSRMRTGDFHEIGSKGTVLGSMGPLHGIYGYFVQWDDLTPSMLPVFITGDAIEEL